MSLSANVFSPSVWNLRSQPSHWEWKRGGGGGEAGRGGGEGGSPSPDAREDRRGGGGGGGGGGGARGRRRQGGSHLPDTSENPSGEDVKNWDGLLNNTPAKF